MTRQMADLLLCIKNDLRVGNIVEDHDLDGFILFSECSRYPSYTIYCAPGGVYSAYISLPNIEKGIGIEDEIPLIELASLFTTVARVKAHHMAANPKAYPGLVEAWERNSFWTGGIFNRGRTDTAGDAALSPA